MRGGDLFKRKFRGAGLLELRNIKENFGIQKPPIPMRDVPRRIMLMRLAKTRKVPVTLPKFSWDK